MEHTLKLKDGKKIILGRQKRNGGNRKVTWDDKAGKLLFAEGGARRFKDASAAERWAKEHNFTLEA